MEVPDALQVSSVAIADLPDGWNRHVEMPQLRRIGEAWAETHGAAVLSVPSAVIPEERNYLINPRHPDAGEVRVADRRPFDFNPRLFE